MSSATTPSTRLKSKKQQQTSPELRCYNCNSSFEISNVGVTEQMYNFIIENKIPGYVWLCISCINAPKQQLTDLKQLLTEKNDETMLIKQKVHDLELYIDNRFTNLEEKFITKVDTQKDALKKNIQSGIKELQSIVVDKAETQQQNIKTYAKAVEKATQNRGEAATAKVLKSIDETVKTLSTNIALNEELEKESELIKKKANNLCFFNIPEPVNDSEEKNYVDDVLAVQKLFENTDKNHDIINSISSIVRRGKKLPDRSRPLVIRFSSLEIRNEVLQLHSLQHKNNNEIKQVFISPDRTRKQQAEHRELVVEMKRQRANGDNARIRNGKVVVLQPFRKSPQLYFIKE